MFLTLSTVLWNSDTYGEKGVDVNVDIEGEICVCTCLSLQRPYKPALERTLSRDHGLRWFRPHRRLWVDSVVEDFFVGQQEWRRAQRMSKFVYNAHAAYLTVANVYGEEASFGWGSVRETATQIWGTLAVKMTKDARGESQEILQKLPSYGKVTPLGL